MTPDHGLRFWLWESADGQKALPEMRDVSHAVFAAGKPILATVHRDGRLRMWTVAPGLSVAQRWSAFVCPAPSALAMDGEAGRVAVGCADGRVEVYESGAGAEIARAEYQGEVHSVAFSEGKHPAFIAAGRDGINGYYLDRADLIREACARISANPTRDQWIRDVGGDCRTVCPNLPPACAQ